MGLPRRNKELVSYLFFLLSWIHMAPSENPRELSVNARDTSGANGIDCNTTLYDRWYDTPYSGALLDDLTDFWLFSDAELSNGQALEVASSKCKVMMKTLRGDRSGRNGPVADKYIYDVMCADECVLSDGMREEAMSVTGCTCLQLSTQPSETTYHTSGDWCAANSARILCEIFGKCGRWNCRFSDFMCPSFDHMRCVTVECEKSRFGFSCEGPHPGNRKTARLSISTADYSEQYLSDTNTTNKTYLIAGGATAAEQLVDRLMVKASSHLIEPGGPKCYVVK